MNRSIAMVFAVAGLATSGASAAVTITTGDAVLNDRTTNLVANGSFEFGNLGVNTGWTPGSHIGGYPGTEVPFIPGWASSYPDGAYGWWGPLGFQGGAIPDGNNAVYFGNAFNSAGTTASIAANGEVTFAAAPTFADRPGPVTLSQTVSGLDTGSLHRLEFWTSGEDNTGGFSGTGIFGLQISGESLAYLLLPASSNAFGASQRYYVDFTPSASSITISFLNWGHITDLGGTGTELVLDDVILNVIPTPGAVGVLAMGGLLAARRRR